VAGQYDANGRVPGFYVYFYVYHVTGSIGLERASKKSEMKKGLGGFILKKKKTGGILVWEKC
jgi:hypothetical protein